MPLTIHHVLTQATADLINYGVPNPRLDAEVLLAHALGFSRAELYARLRDSLSEQDRSRFQQFIQRRQHREPLQYITGVQEFWSLEFRVTPDVLIPRPETELVVETALRLLTQPSVVSIRYSVFSRGESPESNFQASSESKAKRRAEDRVQESLVQIPNPQSQILQASALQPLAPKILDVGTGSGCIAVALAKELPHAELWAIDISSAALAIAQENAQQHSVAERIHFLQGDLFTPLNDLDLTFDLIVSNPPYIARNDILTLQPEVQDWEPHRALDGGTDGLDYYRRLLQESPHYLHGGGWLVMEIGHEQGQAILQLSQQKAELSNSTCIQDYEGRDRVVTAQKL